MKYTSKNVENYYLTLFVKFGPIHPIRNKEGNVHCKNSNRDLVRENIKLAPEGCAKNSIRERTD